MTGVVPCRDPDAKAGVMDNKSETPIHRVYPKATARRS